MGGNKVHPAPGGLPGANNAANNAPQGPPGAQNCGWEVNVTTHSQHRFWPHANFDHQLQNLNGAKLAGVAQTATVTMTDVDSPASKFKGSGAKRFGVTNTTPAIAAEADWFIASGPTSSTKLANQNIAINVADGQAGARAQNINLYVRHPLLIYGQLLFKDPEGRELTFPKDFYVAAYSGKAAAADTEVGHAKLDADGKFNFEIDRKWDWFTFKFGKAKKFISNGDASTTQTELKPWSDRKTLETAEAKFFAPPKTWGLIESDWTFSENPKYIDGTVSYKAKEAKIYVFDPPTKNWVRRIGEQANPLKMTLDPHWQFVRYEYFDRYYGHSDHGHERVNMPSTVIEAYWGKNAKYDREASSHWTLTPDDFKKSVHCLPWIRQKDTAGAAAEKPDKDALIQFEFPERTFAISTAADTRKYAHIGASDDKMKATADRLKYYDMPKTWKSKGYWSRYLTAPKNWDAKFWEDWDQAGMFKSRTKATPMVFSLDDIVLTDDSAVPLQTLAKTDQFSIFYHPFRKAYDEAANVTEEGVYTPDANEPYFSNIERKGAKFNYLADYPNWVRLVAGVGSCFDAFDQRTSKEVFGARAAVGWYDAVKGATAAGTALKGQPKDIAKKYFVIGPEFGQQHASTRNKYIGSNTPAQRIGRFDMVLLRCCDRDGAKEVFLNLQYFRLNFNFLAAAPANTSAGSAGSAYQGNGKAYSKPLLLALMKRWNGYDGAVNGSRAELVPQKNGIDHRGEVLYFLQPSAGLPGAHFRMDVFKSGDGSDRAFMASTDGFGQITDTGIAPDNSWAPDCFTTAHELGHGGSLPDEYFERLMYCSGGGPGITCNTPGDPFVDEGGRPDLAASLAAVIPNTPYPMMTHMVEMRNRYFWHNAEFARKHMDVGFYAKYGAYASYQVPGHPKFPYRSYVYWPVRKKMNRKGRKHGSVDIYLHTLGKEAYSLARIPNGPWDGIVSILIKLDITWPTSVAIADIRDTIRNVFLAFNQQYSASGTTGVNTDSSIVVRDDVKFTKAEVRFSPRFLVADPAQGAAYANKYQSLQKSIGTHFQVNVVDNAGKALAKKVATAFTAKRGGGLLLAIDSTGPWQVFMGNQLRALLPEILGIKLAGAALAAKDLTPLVSSVIHSNAKVS